MAQSFLKNRKLVQAEPPGTVKRYCWRADAQSANSVVPKLDGHPFPDFRNAPFMTTN
jgi:hypothetical protein